MFRSPRSTEPMYERSRPTRSARSSCDQPSASRCLRISAPRATRCALRSLRRGSTRRHSLVRAARTTDYKSQAGRPSEANELQPSGMRIGATHTEASRQPDTVGILQYLDVGIRLEGNRWSFDPGRREWSLARRRHPPPPPETTRALATPCRKPGEQRLHEDVKQFESDVPLRGGSNDGCCGRRGVGSRRPRCRLHGARTYWLPRGWCDSTLSETVVVRRALHRVL